MTWIQSRQLIKQNLCGFQTLLDDLNLRHKKRSKGYIREALFELFSYPIEQWDAHLIQRMFEEFVPMESFESKKGYDMVLEQLSFQVLRFKVFLQKYHFVIRELKPTIQLEVNGETVEVKGDLILESPNMAYWINFDTGKSPFNQNDIGETAKRVRFSMELYLLHLAAEKWSHEKKLPYKARGGLIYLRSKFDDGDQLKEEFQETKNDNVIESSFFDQMPTWRNEMQERLDYLVKHLDDNRPCAGVQCQSCLVSDICQYEPMKSFEVKAKEMAEKSSKEVRWTDEQQAFIDFELGICRSNAVAGAGKTTVIANRFIRLIQKGYSPRGFLLFTFTEKGAQEMREKIIYWLDKTGLGASLSEEMTICTFNGFGYDLIRRYYSRLGFSEEPRLMDRMERISIIRELAEASPMVSGLRYDYPFLNHRYAKGAYFQLSDWFEKLKKLENMGIEDDFVLQSYGECDPLVVSLYREFRDICLKKNLIDYDDQILLACQLLRDSSIVNELKYRHIVVDEMQDTNNEQLYLVQQLVKYPRFMSLVTCGDDSQSIYSFRGAEQSVILDLEKTFPQLVDLGLTNNFRSTKEILELANRLNAQNVRRIDKKIIGHKTGQKPVVLTDDEQIIDVVEQKLKEGIRPSEIAIISFNRNELFKIQEKLMTRGIQSVAAVSEFLKDNQQVKRVVSLARYLKDRQSETELCKFLQFAYYDDYASAKDKKQWFALNVQRFNQRIANLNDYNILTMLLETIKQLSLTYPSCQQLYQMLQERKFNRLSNCLDFLEQIELYDSDACVSPQDDVEAVVLTTAHASKGREFEVVLCLVGTFAPPSNKLAKLNPDLYLEELEEKRRVLFVAITRAKQFLYLAMFPKRTFFTDEILQLMNKAS